MHHKRDVFIFRILFYTTVFLIRSSAYANTKQENLQEYLYTKIRPDSVTEYFAYATLFPNEPSGMRARQEGLRLLLKENQQLLVGIEELILSNETDFNQIIELVNPIYQKQCASHPPKRDPHTLELLLELGSMFPHRQLKGHSCWSEAEVLSLPTEEIDLARAVLITQFPNSPEEILFYEAQLDLMALQIRAHLPDKSTNLDLIRAINHYIFHEKGFRFPPHSTYAQEVDLYTFLPSVMDSRRGVCLGVCILYLSLAQRLGISLEVITPPGHIFVRYRDGESVINIETTARGIHLNTELYLGILIKEFPVRTIKEVVGMAYFNQASIFLQDGHYEKALEIYSKAFPYLSNDLLIQEFIGYTYLLLEQPERAQLHLNHVQQNPTDHSIYPNTLFVDYIKGTLSPAVIKAMLARVDENRNSLLEKKDALQQELKAYPRSLSLQSQLAITWLQLHRPKEALIALEECLKLAPDHPEFHYYLCALYRERLFYTKAWWHLQQAEALTAKHDHHPKILKELRLALQNEYLMPDRK